MSQWLVPVIKMSEKGFSLEEIEGVLTELERFASEEANCHFKSSEPFGSGGGKGVFVSLPRKQTQAYGVGWAHWKGHKTKPTFLPFHTRSILQLLPSSSIVIILCTVCRIFPAFVATLESLI